VKREQRKRIGVIGAGVAGAAAAQAFRHAEYAVVVFDKGGRPGGRCSTRLSETLTFDHGAQYFTVRSTAFASIVADWNAKDVAAPWAGRFMRSNESGPRPDDAVVRWVGRPGMVSIVTAMLGDTEVMFRHEVGSLERNSSVWRLVMRSDQGASENIFDELIISIPAPQAARLLAPVAPHLALQAEQIEMEPCWAVMLAAAHPLNAPFDSVVVENGGPLAWAACENSKPFRATLHERWVLHAAPAWSREHLESDPAWVSQELTRAFAELLGVRHPNLETTHALAHRWRFARVAKPLGQPFLRDPELGLTVCGDWLLGARVEAAWSSGTAAAACIAES